ncbi:MAG: T9SS type A sorting domain-containing protein [Gracilimonas sp.]
MNIKSTVQIIFYAIIFVITGSICQAQTIYQTDFNFGIIATELESGKSTQVLHPNLSYPGGIWVDTNTGELFWADLFAQTVMIAPADSSQHGMRAIANSVDQNLGWPTDVVAVPDMDRIYFTVREGSDNEKESALFSMNYEGQILDTLLSEEDGLERPNGIAVDQVNSIIYVADSEEGIFRANLLNEQVAGPLDNETSDAQSVALDQENAKLYVLTATDEIQKMNIDGSDMEVLVDSGFVDGNQIKLDLEDGKIYWTSDGDSFEEMPGKIQRANLDGSGLEEVYTNEEYGFSGLFLDTSNNTMYVTTRNLTSVLKMDMEGTTVSEIYNENNSGLVDPRKMIYHEGADELIWTRNGDTQYDVPYHVIKTSAEGSGELETLFSNDAEINSLELDEENDRLFWGISQGSQAQLYVGDIDGNNAQMLQEISWSGTTRIRDIAYKASTNEVFWIVDGSEWIAGIYKMHVESDTSSRIHEAEYITDLAYDASIDSLFAYGYNGITKVATDSSGYEEIIVESGRPGGLAIYENRLYWGNNDGLFSSDFAGNNSVLVNNRPVGRGMSIVFGPDIIFTSTEHELSETSIPNRISLKQNYPNPFNPSTSIQFTLPRTINISLKVYNMLGQEVATIFEGRASRGKHNFNFNAKHLASGVYLYRLRAGAFSQTKKFTLIK